jgi:hypothetical protein
MSLLGPSGDSSLRMPPIPSTEKNASGSRVERGATIVGAGIEMMSLVYCETVTRELHPYILQHLAKYPGRLLHI